MEVKEWRNNMKEYKRYVDKQHVTEPMITDILKRIQEENKNLKSDNIESKKKRLHKISIVLGTLVATVILVVGVFQYFANQNALVYTTVDNIMIRSNRDTQIFGDKITGEEMDLEEYELYTGMDFTKLLGVDSLEKSQILVKRDGTQILYDEGIFYYKTEDVQAVIHTSKTKELMPVELESAEVSQLENTNIVVCKNSQETNFQAYFKRNDLNFCLRCIQTEQKDFEGVLKKLL